MLKKKFFLVLGLLSVFVLNAQQAPDFTITDSDGKTRKLYADYVSKGKVVVLEVFFTTCPPCATHAPHWQSLYETVKSQYPGKVEFILLSDKSADNNVAVAQYKTSKGLTMLAAGSDGGSLSAVQPYKSGQFGPFYGTPTFVIITPGTGQVLFDVRGSGPAATMDSIHQHIARMLLPECRVRTALGDTLRNYRLQLDVPGGAPVQHQVADGVFTLESFGNLPGLPFFEIAASKKNDPLNGVSTYDLVQINKQILGITPFQEPWQFVAADANNSGSISTFDIVELRKLILGVYDTLPNSPSWVFAPAKDTISPLACPDFTAIKRGDVNGNASADSLMAGNDRTGFSGRLWLDDPELQAGQFFQLEVRIDRSAAWEGFQGSLLFEPRAVEITALHSDALSGWNPQAWQLREGQVRWSWLAGAAVDLPAGAAVLRIEGRALRAGRLSDGLQAGKRLPTEAYPAAGERLSLDWVFGNRSASGLTVAPNPARAWIGVWLEHAAAERLPVELLSPEGRVVYRQHWDLRPGENYLELRPANLPAGWYALRVGDQAPARVLWRP